MVVGRKALSVPPVGEVPIYPGPRPAGRGAYIKALRCAGPLTPVKPLYGRASGEDSSGTAAMHLFFHDAF